MKATEEHLEAQLIDHEAAARPMVLFYEQMAQRDLVGTDVQAPARGILSRSRKRAAHALMGKDGLEVPATNGRKRVKFNDIRTYH